jgi:hypothetical protein
VGQPNPIQQCWKSWIAAERIVERVYLESDQRIGMLGIGLFQPKEGPILVSQADVGANEKSWIQFLLLVQMFEASQR